MKALSSNGFSHDMQVDDVLDYLRGEMSESDYKDGLIIAGFYDEVERRVLDGAHFDTEAMGVDVEWSSWLTDWIEANTPVFWWEGEPFVLEDGEQHPDADDDPTIEQLNWLHSLMQELENSGVELPMGDYGIVYSIIEGLRDD